MWPILWLDCVDVYRDDIFFRDNCPQVVEVKSGGSSPKTSSINPQQHLGSFWWQLLWLRGFPARVGHKRGMMFNCDTLYFSLLMFDEQSNNTDDDDNGTVLTHRCIFWMRLWHDHIEVEAIFAQFRVGVPSFRTLEPLPHCVFDLDN